MPEKEYKLHATEMFEKKFDKLIPADKKEDMRRRIAKLKCFPYSGKPLGYKYFRELKLGKFRVYYEIFEQEIFILLLTISDKKNQQETIDIIKGQREEIREYIKNLNLR